MSEKNRAGGVYDKVRTVSEQVGEIPKTGHNDHFGYDYHEADKVMAELRPLLAEVGLVIIPHQVEIEDVAVETRSGNAFLTTVKHEIEVVDTEDGSSFRFPVYGRGQDSADKGPTKAYTMAYKYGVMKLFGIASSQSDPDAAAPAKQNGSKGQADDTVTCPECGGEAWDNREDKEAGRVKQNYPNFKCQDRDCDWVSWDSYEEVYGSDNHEPDDSQIEELLQELRGWDADRADKARQYYEANSSGIHASQENEQAFVEQLEDRIEKAKDAAEQEVAG